MNRRFMPQGGGGGSLSGDYLHPAWRFCSGYPDCHGSIGAGNHGSTSLYDIWLNDKCPYGQLPRTIGQFFGTISRYPPNRARGECGIHPLHYRSFAIEHSPSTHSDTYGVWTLN